MFTTYPRHETLGEPINATPPGSEVAYFAMGCFWGAEKLFWQTPGVLTTAVGYMGGQTPNPSYRETCTGRTGHTETVRVVFDPTVVSYRQLLESFFENHDPTQLDRQGNDIGSQYRSAIFTTSERQAAEASQAIGEFQDQLTSAGRGRIVTTVEPAGVFYYAEPEHQQYLYKVPHGYCPSHATGVCFNKP